MKLFPRQLRFCTVLIVLASMSALDIVPAMAGLAPSRTSGETSIASARDADMLVAQRALENKVVAQKLRDYGLAPAEANTRLANMSDQDLHTLASASEGLPSGGDATGGLISVLVIIILVIVILRLTHYGVITR